MRIFVFASSITSCYWNGAATYYRGMYRNLAALGHEIIFAEPDIYGRQQNRDRHQVNYAKVIVYRTPCDIDGLIAQAAEAGLVVKHSGVGADDELLEARVLECRSARTRVAFWDVDAPATLARVEADPGDPFRRLIPQYDFIFTYGGGAPVVRHYSALGARNCHPIYNALEAGTHHPVPPDPALLCDLLFVGNRLPDREQRVEEFFLRAAELAPEMNFILGGEGWSSKSLPPNVRWIGHVSSSRHNILNCSARMVLNVNRESMAKVGFSPPTRIFEAAGAAACLITDHWAGIETFFAPGRELLVAASAAEVVVYLRGIDPRQAHSIGGAMRARALKDHTYALRAAEVDAILGASVADAPATRSAPTRALKFQGRRRAAMIPRASSFKLVIFGLSITSSWGNGHATTFRALARALDSRGHRVVFYERNQKWYASNRDLPDPEFCQLKLYDDWNSILPEVRRELKDCDVAMVGSYCPDGIQAIEELALSRVPVKTFYDIDTPVTLAALGERGETGYLKARQIPLFDLYFSFTGGPILKQIEERFGAAVAIPLYCSVDPDKYYKHPVAKRYTCEMSYMGTYAADRQPKLDSMLCQVALQLPEHKFIVAGPQYPKSIQWPANVHRIMHLNPRWHPHLYSSSRLTLNVTRRDMVAAGYSPSVRLFEAAACAAAIVSDPWPGLENFFTPGCEILLPADSAEIVSCLRELPDSELEKIGARAQQRVLAEHTNFKRAEQFERAVESMRQLRLSHDEQRSEASVR